MNTEVPEKRFRITIKERASFGDINSSLDLSDLDELKDYLKERSVVKLSLKFKTILDDIPDLKEGLIGPDDLTKEMFEWLVNNSFGTFKFLEIVTLHKK